LEDLMVEIRVAVGDAADAHGLLRRLADFFDRSSLSFDGTRNEVNVHSERSRSVIEVIATVESWLASDGIDSARLSLGDRSYTMRGPGLGAPIGHAGSPRPPCKPLAATNGKAPISPVAKR
jgi:hypothetical protein